MQMQRPCAHALQNHDGARHTRRHAHMVNTVARAHCPLPRPLLHARACAAHSPHSHQPSADEAKGKNNILAAYNKVYDAYKMSGILHAVNSVQFAIAWLPLGYSWCHAVMIPE